MVVSSVDVFCRLSKDLEVDDKEIPHTIEKKSRRRRCKSVTFADAKGLALTSTFFFTTDNPSPSVTRRRSVCTSIKDAKRQSELGQPARLLNFTLNLSYKDNLNKVETTNVCLESIVCYTFGIYGRIHVKNIGYEKCVSVRYTFDAWQSSNEETAKYIYGASTKTTDTFFFHIRPPKTTTDRKMEFAIRYRVCGKEFWDNNFGDNYRLVYYKSTQLADTKNLSLRNDPPDRNI